ncbi:acyltransferase [Aliarcobacter cryaerophilus]|uniref:acyltransferase n=1 Tax=Aliarcobacter cryaerophilus TaxID=28198 RepID=UPI0021B6AC1B|nr:acyltransferase [Aliarcobacter cryaerophilus]MCT7517020.1 acyltransferase [Aliarcobacter cryaerophilus]
MKNKLIYLIYVILSKLSDFYMVGFWFRNITKLRAKVLNLLPNMQISNNVRIYRGVQISRNSNFIFSKGVTIKEYCVLGGNIEIGESTQILGYTKIDGSGKVTIGRDTHIGRENDIFSHYHDISKKDTLVNESKEYYQETIIGDNVMLYSRVAVMGGVTIENNSAIAYGSIVTKNCKENIIYAGIPAKKIGERI